MDVLGFSKNINKISNKISIVGFLRKVSILCNCYSKAGFERLLEKFNGAKTARNFISTSESTPETNLLVAFALICRKGEKWSFWQTFGQPLISFRTTRKRLASTFKASIKRQALITSRKVSCR